MSRSRKQVRRPRKLPLWGAVSLIALLGAAALALSYIALTGVGSGDNQGLPVRSGGQTSVEAVASDPPTSADPQPQLVTGQAQKGAEQRLLTMVNGTTMRATGGTCENPGTVEVSLDAGQSWSTSDSLATAGATQILRLLPTDPSLVQVVALDASCEPQVYRSTDLGTSWEGPLPVFGTWFFDPSTPSQVEAPDGTQSLPCDGAELAAAGERAAMRCLDGSVVTTVDRGFTWTESPGITDVLAINTSPDSYVMAQAGNETCQGLRLTSLADGAFSSVDGCLETDLSAEELNAGSIAIAQSGAYTLAWVGDDLLVSTDGGGTWL